MRKMSAIIALTLAFGSSTLTHAASRRQLCEAAKLTAAGKDSYCRLLAEAKFAKTLSVALFTKAIEQCNRTIAKRWSLIENKFGTDCPTTEDQPIVQDVVEQQCVAPVARKLGGPSRVFLTSVVYPTANLGGLAGADAKCQALANAQALGGTWIAWLSTSSTNAKDRLTSDGPFLLLDGTIVADDLADLTDGTLDAAIDLTETSQTSTGGGFIFTGTKEDGTRDMVAPGTQWNSANCLSWTSAEGFLGLIYGTVGASGHVDSLWTNAGGIACSSATQFYCFETP